MAPFHYSQNHIASEVFYCSTILFIRIVYYRIINILFLLVQTTEDILSDLSELLEKYMIICKDVPLFLH